MTAAVLTVRSGRCWADLDQPSGLRLSGRKREGNDIADLLQMQRGVGGKESFAYREGLRVPTPRAKKRFLFFLQLVRSNRATNLQ